MHCRLLVCYFCETFLQTLFGMQGCPMLPARQTSRFTGVKRRVRNKVEQWEATVITLDGREECLGLLDKEEEAAWCAYMHNFCTSCSCHRNAQLCWLKQRCPPRLF